MIIEHLRLKDAGTMVGLWTYGAWHPDVRTGTKKSEKHASSLPKMKLQCVCIRHLSGSCGEEIGPITGVLLLATLAWRAQFANMR